MSIITPIVVENDQALDDLNRPYRQRLRQLREGLGWSVRERLVAHPRLVVLQGHLHVDEELRFGPQRYLMGGAVCGRWWQGANHGTPEGFGLLSVSDAGVAWEYRALPYSFEGA